MSAVRFIVVAEGSDGNEIEQVARKSASQNPVGRRVVVRGDPDYPSAAEVQGWVSGEQDPGAVVLRRDGSLHRVLKVSFAKQEIFVDSTFAEAGSAGGPS